jgi:tetratricopeptide (TPR) repeat protein
MANGRLDEALADLKRSIELYPSSAKSHELNAIAYIFKGKLNLALQEAQAAHQIDQISYIPHAQAAIAYWAEGNREEARRTLNKAIQIAPESEILKDINEAFKAESTPASQGNTGILKSPLTKLLQILE